MNEVQKTKPELPTEYLIEPLGIKIKYDGQVLSNLPEHNIVTAAGGVTKTKCPSTTGYGIIMGRFPVPRAKARCGKSGDPNSTCFKTWR